MWFLKTHGLRLALPMTCWTSRSRTDRLLLGTARLCPCRAGSILEEHDNIPGFREHDLKLMCDVCREE